MLAIASFFIAKADWGKQGKEKWLKNQHYDYAYDYASSKSLVIHKLSVSKVSLIFLKVISLKNVDWQLSGEIQTDPSLWFQFVFGCPLNCKTKTGFLLRQILLSAAQQKFPKGPSIKEVRIFLVIFDTPSPHRVDQKLRGQDEVGRWQRYTHRVLQTIQRNLYFYGSGQSGPFWAELKLL